MTNQEKIEIFERAVEDIKTAKVKELKSGLCSAINHATDYYKNLNDFPELMQHEPKERWTENSRFWFDPYDYDTRIKILQTEINKLKAMDENLKSKLIELTKKGEDLTSWVKKEFPEAFEEDKSVGVNYCHDLTSREGIFLLCSRGSGKYGEKAFRLNDEFNWEIKHDDENFLVLIPTRK